MALINDFSRLLILLLSLLGYGILINKKLKIPGGIIPIFLFSAIIIVEYFAAIISLLSLITDFIILSGFLLAIYYLLTNLLSSREKIFTGLTWIINKIKTQKKNPSILFLIPLSLCISISISIRIDHYWNQLFKIKSLILIGIFVIILFLFFIAYNLYSEAIVKNKKIAFISIAIAIICAIIFIPSRLPLSTPFPNKNDTIEIINTGKKNIKSEGFSIKLVEIKDSITQENIVEEKYKSQINYSKDLKYLLIDQKNDKDIFFYASHHLTNYEILFITDKDSGLVRININGNESEIDLFSESASLFLFKAPIQYNALTFLIVCADVVSFILIVSILCWVYINGYKSNQRENKTSTFLKPGFILFSISIIALFFITKDYLFSGWDEFSNWGTLIKELSIINELPGKLFCSVFPNYVPGFSLFQYFIIRILGYTEGHAYYANSIFILAGIYTLIADLNWHKLTNLFIVVLCFFQLMCFLPLIFFSLYVDVLLGILFGAGCIAYFIFIDKKVNLLYLLIFISAIQLIKTWGIVFAVFIYCIVVCHQLFLKRKLGDKSTVKKELILFTLLFILSTIIIQGSWLIHLSVNGILSNPPEFYNINDHSSRFSETGVINNLDNFLNMMFYAINIIKYGRNNLGLNSPLTILNIVGILVIVGIILSFLNKRIKNEILIIDFLMTVFLIINIILVLLYMTFFFSFYESPRLASFERYISEFLLGWFMIIFYFFNVTTSKIGDQKFFQIIPFMPIFLFVLLFFGIKQKNYFAPPYKELISQRSEINEMLLKFPSIRYQGNTRSKIYNIDQNSNGLEHHILRYELCPNIIQTEAWSIATSPDNYGRFTVYKSLEEFHRQIINGFDFILITQADENFWRDYGQLFPGHSISESQLYKVTDKGFVRMQ